MKKLLVVTGAILAVSLAGVFILTWLSQVSLVQGVQGPGCDGCERTAVLKAAINVDRPIESYLAERATSPCFHLLNKGEVIDYSEKLEKQGLPLRGAMFKEPEYYFTTEYEDSLKGAIKSRFIIQLFFYTGELVHQWVTTSDRPTFTFNGHLNRMFRNPRAVFRQSVPLDVHVLNEFEKRPYDCDIRPEREEVIPGEEIKVEISNIRDIQGQPSREFNRLVLQSVHGEIVEGADLAVDPSLKAFQVGEGQINFTYRAPGGSSEEEVSEDTIYVYNACEILDPKMVPLELTTLKDKIAEKKITITKKRPVLEINFNVNSEFEASGQTYYSTSSSNFSGTIRFYLKLSDSHTDDGEIHQSYESTQCEVTGFHGSLKGFKKSWLSDGQTRTEVSKIIMNLCDKSCPSSAVDLVLDKEGGVKEVQLGGFELQICLQGSIEITDFDGRRYNQEVPFSAGEQLKSTELFILDPKKDFGVFQIKGFDQGSLRSGLITGSRAITGGNEYKTTKKKITYQLRLE